MDDNEKNTTTEMLDSERDKLPTLSVKRWAKRVNERYPALTVRYFDYAFDDVPPGWRWVVEAMLDFALKDAREQINVPLLTHLSVHNRTLIMLFANAEHALLQKVAFAIQKTEDICEQCGRESNDVALREVRMGDVVKGMREQVVVQRRLCPRCFKETHPLANSRYALRVMTSVTEGGDRGDKVTINAYREALVDLPTSIASIPDLQQLKSVLDTEYPWYAEVTRRITRSLAGRLSGNGWFKLRPLLLTGAPGAGKSSYIQRLAELSGVPARLLPLGGEHTSMLLKGTARGWSTARPCAALEFIKEAGVANPILILDELDKAGGSAHNGSVHETLLQLIEPATAAHYFDSYLLGTANLAWVSWVATVNDHRRLPQALLSRMEVIHVEMPQPEHYPAIVERSMARYAREHDIPAAMMPVLGEAEWQWLQHYYTSPRVARRAVEELLAALLSEPGLSGFAVH